MTAVETIRPCPAFTASTNGQRYRLREFLPSDTNDIAQMHKDPRVGELLLDGLPLCETSQAGRFVRQVQEGYQKHPGLGTWAVDRFVARHNRETLSESGVLSAFNDDVIEKLIQPQWCFSGWFNLTPIAPEATDNIELHGSIELGSRLVPEVWGSRLSLQGGDALVKHAFDELKLEQLFIHVHSEHRSALFCTYFLGFDDPKPATYAGKPALRFVLNAQQYTQTRRSDSRDRRRMAQESVRRQLTNPFTATLATEGKHASKADNQNANDNKTVNEISEIKMLGALAAGVDQAIVLLEANTLKAVWHSEQCIRVEKAIKKGFSFADLTFAGSGSDAVDGAAIALNKEQHRVRWQQADAQLNGLGNGLLILKFDLLKTDQLSHYLSEREQLFLQSRTISVSEMATTLAHELNQPIGTISNMISGMQARLDKNPDPDERFQQALTIVGEQTHFASRIISRIRDFTDSRKPQFESCHLHELISKSVSLLDWVFATEQVTILRDTASPEFLVRGDTTMLQQVLTNLFRNSVDAMREAAGSEKTIQILCAKEDNFVKIEIVDSGTGLKPTTEKTLYSPFVTNKKNGMGVGLNICRSFVELHQGRLWLTNNDNSGCTAHILLPLADTEES